MQFAPGLHFLTGLRKNSVENASIYIHVKLSMSFLVANGVSGLSLQQLSFFICKHSSNSTIEHLNNLRWANTRDHVAGTCRSNMQQQEIRVLYTQGVHVVGTCNGRSLYNMYTHMKMERKQDPPTSPIYTTFRVYLYANIVGARIL